MSEFIYLDDAADPILLDNSVRPENFSEFIGQDDVISNLKIYSEAAQMRAESLDHVLFSGPPGLGKTTLARIVSSLQKGNFYQIAAPNLKRTGDLVKLLVNLEKMDTLFIDEIHRLPAPVEEILYSAMEDGHIDIAISEGMSGTPVKINLPPFTLVGATTRPGSLTAPLRDRFGIQLRLNYYTDEEIESILKRAAGKWGIQVSDEAFANISARCRKTPRVALKLLKRIWDFALVRNGNKNALLITEKDVLYSFENMKIDQLGLTQLDNMFLRVVAVNYKGGPVGLKPLTALLSEDIITLEEFVEPYLVQLDLIQRTSRGRIITEKGFNHIGVDSGRGMQNGLF